jgi:hypothetical protein
MPSTIPVRPTLGARRRCPALILALLGACEPAAPDEAGQAADRRGAAPMAGLDTGASPQDSLADAVFGPEAEVWREAPDTAADAALYALARDLLPTWVRVVAVHTDPADPAARVYTLSDGDRIRLSKDLRGPAVLDPGAHLDPADRAPWIELGAIFTVPGFDTWAEGVESPPPPPVACSAPCGRDDRLSYAGVEAMSNGSTTGSGTSCSGGDSFQCTQVPDKVHKRHDSTYTSRPWTGNANAYVGSTGAEAWAKDLIPFAPGSAYDAPLAGDPVTFRGGRYGHIGVISSVSSTFVQVLDQNRSCGDQSCKLQYSSSSGRHTLTNTTGTDYCGSEGLSPSSWPVEAYLRRGWDFSGAFGTSGWTLNQARYTAGTTSGSASDLSDHIELEATGTDPYIVSPSGLALQAYSSSATHGYNKVVMRIKSDCSNKDVGFYWKPFGGAFSATNKVNTTLSGTGWNDKVVSLSGASGWTGLIDQVRLDTSERGTSGCKVQVAYMYFDR